MQNSSIKIAVIGSMDDVPLHKQCMLLAEQIGELIAQSGATLLFGFEGDHTSLSEIAANSAIKNNGRAVAFLWGKISRQNKQPIQHPSLISIFTGQIRGGGRELALVLSADVVICIAGGTGTLTEICFAYQADIPIIALKKSGGWSTKLAGEFLDHRKRAKIIGVKTPKEAVHTAIKLARRKK